MRTAFCLSTDATGVRIQPGPLQDRARGPCRKGHFFVVLADRDHVFFEYQERHTSAAVCSMFKGYSMGPRIVAIGRSHVENAGSCSGYCRWCTACRPERSSSTCRVWR